MADTKPAKKLLIYRQCPRCEGSGRMWKSSKAFVNEICVTCDRCNGTGEIETGDYVWVEDKT